MTLDDLLIDDTTRARLDVVTSDMPQALILHGKRGVGLSTIAQAMATQCGTLLDILYPKKRAPNGSYTVDTVAGTVIIDHIRALYERTRSKFTSPHIIIIDLSGRPMSPGAQNAFLKLLEEPQSYINFIIVTHDMTTLLPTVVSRCQRVDVVPISQAQTTSLLDSLGVTNATKRARMLFIAAGLPAEITRLATNDTYYDERVKTVQDARAILEGDAYVRLTIIQSYRDKRAGALQLIDDMTHQLALSLQKSPTPTIVTQLDSLTEAYERIRGNGAIQLTLAKVLL